MSDQTPPSDAPMPPPESPMPPAPAMGVAPQNGMGTAGLVMAILQFVCLGPIASVLAIVFGRIGMNKAKRGEATNGGVATAAFWLGIVGLVLTTIGIIVAVVIIGAGAKAVTETLDPAMNSETGLVDGNYGMNPDTSLSLNERCAFGGKPVNIDTADMSDTHVTVVGQGPIECGNVDGTPAMVLFTVSGGVAQITEVG
jgi:hypothetical protein